MLHTLRRAAQTFEKSLYNAQSKNGSVPPLYDRNPGWWARWAWGLLALDVAFTVSSCDLVFNHWTEISVTNTTAATNASQDTSNAAKGSTHGTSNPSENEWVLRPLWQRLGLATCQLLVGAVVGGAILAARDRYVWRLRVIHREGAGFPTTQSKNTLKLPEPDRLLTFRWLRVETASGRKKEYPMQRCSIGRGRDDTEMFLKIQDVRGHYLLGMKGAKILGQSGSDLKSLQNRLMGFWYGKNKNRVMMDRRGWTGGPVTMESK